MKHRPGVTLVEVLVAIFIMGVGMIALLTLFPLGAVNIALALRDDRAAQAANNAYAYSNTLGLQHDANINTEFTSQLSAANGYRRHLATGPSSAIYVDPFYVRLGAGNLGALAAPLTPVTRGIRRVRPSYAVPPPGGNDRLETYWFSLLDDLIFDQTGLPTTTGAGNNTTVERTGRYTWAYMLRRPILGDESVVDMAVVVYADRTTAAVAGEQTYPATGSFGTNTLILKYNGLTKPRIRNGSWILDTTQDTYANPAAGNPPTYPVTRGYFYRVVDAAEDAALQQYTLEIQNPLRAPPAGGTAPQSNPPTNPPTNIHSIVVMEKVAEVFDRGTGYVP